MIFNSSALAVLASGNRRFDSGSNTVLSQSVSLGLMRSPKRSTGIVFLLSIKSKSQITQNLTEPQAELEADILRVEQSPHHRQPSPSAESSISIPFLVIDRPNLLLPAVEINKSKTVGIMTHACTSRNFRRKIKDLNLVKICDSGVFLKASNQDNLTYSELFNRYEEMKADYGIIFDVLGDAIATVKSAEEAMNVYQSSDRFFNLVGVAQGQNVEEYVQCAIQLTELGYQHIAIGGMLKKHENSARYVRVRDNNFLVKVLNAIRKVWSGWLFCLGCYHPSKAKLFEQYKVFGSDSKRWAFKCDRGLSTEDRHKQIITNFLAESRTLISIPCLIRQPNKQPFEGLIVGDRGSQFDVQVGDRIVQLPKLYVFPNFQKKGKVQAKDDISPSKSSRRKKGTGSGYINWRDIRKNGKSYKQTWFHYELWDKGRQVKSCVYIPKGKRSQIEKMNAEKAPVEEILRVLKNK